MDLCAEPTAASPHGLVSLTVSGPSSVLVRSDDRAVDEVDRPIQPSMAIREALQSLQEALPATGILPAIEATRDGVPRAMLRRQITPGSTGGQDPEDAIDDASIRKVGSADAESL